MPTYDYQCQDCGHHFEKFQSMTARVMRKCPECGERSLERLIGPGAGFIFKGNGFYVTDYRSKSYQDAKRADSTSKTPPAAKSGDDKGAARAKPDKTSSGDKPADRKK